MAISRAYLLSTVSKKSVAIKAPMNAPTIRCSAAKAA